MSIDALDARWDGFLAKLRERFEEVMAESQAGCAALLHQTGGDTMPVSNAWTAMRMRALGLQSKVEETWSAQVQDQFIAAGASSAQLDRALARGEALRDWMEVEVERVEIEIFASASRSLVQLAEAEQAQLRCSQCGAVLLGPGTSIRVTLRAIDLACSHCRSLNTIEPGPRARMAEAMAHYFWREATWDAWLAKHEAERAHRKARGTTLALLQAWERAELGYWRAWLGERAKLMPGVEKDFDKDLIGRMRQFYDSLEREPAWTKAGRPRQIDSFLAARAHSD